MQSLCRHPHQLPTAVEDQRMRASAERHVVCIGGVVGCTSVGAISAAWKPDPVAASMAKNATTVLPQPTSPCKRAAYRGPPSDHLMKRQQLHSSRRLIIEQLPNLQFLGGGGWGPLLVHPDS